MKQETLQRAREVIAEIRKDCEADAAKLEKRPFDARNVAEVFGETLALVHGLAGVVEQLLGRPGEDSWLH